MVIRLTPLSRPANQSFIIKRCYSGSYHHVINIFLPLSLNFKVVQIGDSYIQNFNLGRYIVEYKPGNLVLRQHLISDLISDDYFFFQTLSRPANQSFFNHVLNIYLPLQLSFKVVLIGESCIQNFHLGRYIVGYRPENINLQ